MEILPSNLRQGEVLQIFLLGTWFIWTYYSWICSFFWCWLFLFLPKQDINPRSELIHNVCIKCLLGSSNPHWQNYVYNLQEKPKQLKMTSLLSRIEEGKNWKLFKIEMSSSPAAACEPQTLTVRTAQLQQQQCAASLCSQLGHNWNYKAPANCNAHETFSP